MHPEVLQYFNRETFSKMEALVSRETKVKTKEIDKIPNS